MKDVYAYIDVHADDFVADLQAFVQQPSVFAQGIGLCECGTRIRDMIHRDGLPTELHEPENGPPVVNGASAEGAMLKHVWIPCVPTGFANPGCNLHAPDENIHVDKHAAAITDHFGRS
ncbi:hypothetical protein [Gymnodinialimonas sp.]